MAEDAAAATKELLSVVDGIGQTMRKFAATCGSLRALASERVSCVHN